MVSIVPTLVVCIYPHKLDSLLVSNWVPAHSLMVHLHNHSARLHAEKENERNLEVPARSRGGRRGVGARATAAYRGGSSGAVPHRDDRQRLFNEAGILPNS